jgi:hypothetical protein
LPVGHSAGVLYALDFGDSRNQPQGRGIQYSGFSIA